LTLMMFVICRNNAPERNECTGKARKFLSSNLLNSRVEFGGTKVTILTIRKEYDDFGTMSIILSKPRLVLSSKGKSVIFKDAEYGAIGAPCALVYSHSPSTNGNDGGGGNSVSACDSLFQINCSNEISADSIVYYLSCVMRKDR